MVAIMVAERPDKRVAVPENMTGGSQFSAGAFIQSKPAGLEDDGLGKGIEEMEDPTIAQGGGLGRGTARFYAELTLFMAIVSGWMLVLFGGIIYLILEHYCPDAADARDPSEAFKACIDLKGADYGKNPALIAFLAYQVAFWPYAMFWGGDILSALFSRAEVFPRGNSYLYALVFFSLVAIAACVVTNVKLGDPVHGLTSMLPLAVCFYSCQYLSARRLSAITMLPGLVMPYMLGAFISNFSQVVYKFSLPILITNQTSNGARAIFRLVVHPIIFQMWSATYRYWLRYVRGGSDGLQSIALVYSLIYGSVMGRFLLVQIAGPQEVVMIAAALAFYRLIGDTFTRNRDIWVTRVVHGKRAAEALLSTPESVQVRMSEDLLEIVLEVAGTLGTALFMTSAQITPTGMSAPPAPAAIWTSALVQVAIIFVEKLGVGLNLASRFHSLAYLELWQRMDKRRLLRHLLFHVTFVCSRLCLDVLAIFCPRRHAALGVVLEYCDSPAASI